MNIARNIRAAAEVWRHREPHRRHIGKRVHASRFPSGATSAELEKGARSTVSGNVVVSLKPTLDPQVLTPEQLRGSIVLHVAALRHFPLRFVLLTIFGRGVAATPAAPRIVFLLSHQIEKDGASLEVELFDHARFEVAPILLGE